MSQEGNNGDSFEFDPITYFVLLKIRYLKDFTALLNQLHKESRVYSSVVPNASVKTLAVTDIVANRDNLNVDINNEFRRLFFRAMNYYDDVLEFINDVSSNVDELIAEYTECYRTLPVEFNNESDEDLLSIARCYESL